MLDPITPLHIQGLAALLFGLGLMVVASRRNVFFTLMGVEILLNAVNLSFVGFARTLPGTASTDGQVIPLFVVALAAAEACIGLSLLVLLHRNRETLDSDACSRTKD